MRLITPIIATLLLCSFSLSAQEEDDCSGGDRYVQQFPNSTTSWKRDCTVDVSEAGVNELKNKVLESLLADIGFNFKDKLCTGDCPSGEVCNYYSLRTNKGLTFKREEYNTNVQNNDVTQVCITYSFGAFDEDEKFTFWADCECMEEAQARPYEDNTDFEEYTNLELDVSPNPTIGDFLVKIKVPQAEQLEINVLNSVGQVVYQKTTYALKGIFQQRIELEENTPSGVYIVQIRLADEMLNKKLMLKK